MASESPPKWHKTACILCECNCGIEVQLGGEKGRRFTRIRGDKAHPGSKGYACEKANRLDHYQNGSDRVTKPLRRREDGSFEEISWEVAIREVAGRLSAIRDEHGGEAIFYQGGGGQGNHLPGAYSGPTLSALGSKFKSNPLAQEKTGEMWVNGKMFGCVTRADFDRCDVAVFIGKNPWHSHGIPHARVTLREIAKDPSRKMIVIDPRVSETAEMADVHLDPNPGCDAWLLSAMIAVVLQEGLADSAFLDAHTHGGETVWPHFEALDVADYCHKAGVSEPKVREAARIIARAARAAFAEDLGVQMNRHSTLVSYLHRLLCLVTGHFGGAGKVIAPRPFQLLTRSIAASGVSRKQRVSPVAGAKIIGGLVPCNVVAEEILSDHPDRYRAMIVEASNPAHSYADSPSFRAACEKLDLLVVIDVALTETAQCADYVLPTSTQYEKAEATFFNFEYPDNVFYLRKPLLEPIHDVLPEAEIHARLLEALGVMPEDTIAALREALDEGRDAFTNYFIQDVLPKPELMRLAPVLLYRTLGQTLGDAASGAVIWGIALMLALDDAETVRRAGFEGEGLELGNALFDAIIESPTGVVFSRSVDADNWERVRGGRVELAIPELLDLVDTLVSEEPLRATSEFPLILSAGERRSFTANTIYRDPSWRKKDLEGALRISEQDAGKLGLATGDVASLSTKAGNAKVLVEVVNGARAGHIALPNGYGLTNEDGGVVGVPPNELTSADDRDPIAGTPWHKSVPARLEAT